MVLLGTIGYLPLTLVLTGGIDLLTVKPLVFLLGGLAVLMSFVSGAVLLRRLMAWLSVKEAKFSAAALARRRVRRTAAVSP